MRPIFSFLLIVVAGFLLEVAPALTLPVSEDISSASSPLFQGQRVFAPGSGTAKSLSISADQAAFIRFEVGDFAGDLAAADVDRALLMIYVTKISHEGSIRLHGVTEDWTETAGLYKREPAYSSTPITTIPSGSVLLNQFVLIDVTAQVKAWLNTPAGDHGFVLVGEAEAKVQMGSKEGGGLGYPAILQIERGKVVGNDRLASGIDASKLGTGAVDNDELGRLDGVTANIQPQLEGLGTSIRDTNGNVEGKVSKSGDTMTGKLVLPRNGLVVGTNQLSIASGGVGIGMNASDVAALQVQGDVRLGRSGIYYAPGGEENLRLVRGTIRYRAVDSLSKTGGTGFTFFLTGAKNSDILINFSTAFSALPTITFQQELGTDSSVVASMALKSVTTKSAIIVGGASVIGNSVHFTAVGPR